MRINSKLAQHLHSSDSLLIDQLLKKEHLQPTGVVGVELGYDQNEKNHAKMKSERN